MQPRKSSNFGSLVILFVLLGALFFGWTKQNAIYDWWRLRGYEPSSVVVQLASDTTMTDSMRRVFYVHHPVLQDKEQFQSSCTDTEKTIVLGCYVQKRGIYLYNVTDQRLKGILQVTAAHESLHAAYDRLSSKERLRIDELTAQAFEKVTNERIRANIDAYRQRDLSVIPNELHSIMGTEVRELPQELEDYYKRYFADRSVVVGLSEQYEKEFTDRQEKVKAADAQLKELKVQIDTLSAQLEQQAESIRKEYERMQALRRAGQTEAYNAAVPGYNQTVVSHNAAIRRLQSYITQHNSLVEERNALVVEESELIKAIDSRPSTIETQ